ncbi:hypothetical protein PAXRUDRAFT_174644, partial [Paxillus rubicundulus Ve08.2h10]
DSRTCNMDGPTSGTSCDSGQVKMGPLAEDKEGQHGDGVQNASTNISRQSTPLPYATRRPTYHCYDILDTPYLFLDHLTHSYSTCTMLSSCINDLPVKPDATEMVQSYWGSVPEPLDTRTQGMEAHTLTPHTVDTTHSPACCKLPYWVTAQAWTFEHTAAMWTHQLRVNYGSILHSFIYRNPY